MIKEHDIVVALTDISDKIPKGTIGCVLSAYNDGKAFLVEFVDKNGLTIGNGMKTVNVAQINLKPKS